MKLNDDPMLNYGAAVTIKHASSRNPMRNMTPKELGDFLQNDPDMVMLLANSECRPAERAKVRQTIIAAVAVVSVAEVRVVVWEGG